MLRGIPTAASRLPPVVLATAAAARFLSTAAAARFLTTAAAARFLAATTARILAATTARLLMMSTACISTMASIWTTARHIRVMDIAYIWITALWNVLVLILLFIIFSVIVGFSRILVCFPIGNLTARPSSVCYGGDPLRLQATQMCCVDSSKVVHLHIVLNSIHTAEVHTRHFVQSAPPSFWNNSDAR
jgi:hypothetical protein